MANTPADPLKAQLPEEAALLEAERAHAPSGATVREALRRLVDHAVYVDNGYCSICHGHWPNEHAIGCEGAQALAALRLEER